MTMETNNIESLTAKIAHISAKVGKIEKSGTSAGYGDSYNYIEYGVVAGKLRDLLDEYKVIIYPEIKSYECQEITSQKGKAGYHYILSMHFTISNGEKLDDKMECDWLGEATDYGDKGVNKAITAATKYFIMRLLQVSEKGDEDPDSITPEPHKESEKPKKTNDGLDFDKIRKQCKDSTDEDLIRKRVEVKTFKGYSDKQKDVICKIIQEEIDSRKEAK